jgi:hypothetical protein
LAWNNTQKTLHHLRGGPGSDAGFKRGTRRKEANWLEKKTLLSVDGRFRFWRDVGFCDKLARSLVITPLFAIVQDVYVEPGREHARVRFETRDVRDWKGRRQGWKGMRGRDVGERDRKGTQTFYRHPRWFGLGLAGQVEVEEQIRMTIQGVVGLGGMLPLWKRGVGERGGERWCGVEERERERRGLRE